MPVGVRALREAVVEQRVAVLVVAAVPEEDLGRAVRVVIPGIDEREVRADVARAIRADEEPARSPGPLPRTVTALLVREHEGDELPPPPILVGARDLEIVGVVRHLDDVAPAVAARGVAGLGPEGLEQTVPQLDGRSERLPPVRIANVRPRRERERPPRRRRAPPLERPARPRDLRQALARGGEEDPLAIIGVLRGRLAPGRPDGSEAPAVVSDRPRNVLDRGLEPGLFGERSPLIAGLREHRPNGNDALAGPVALLDFLEDAQDQLFGGARRPRDEEQRDRNEGSHEGNVEAGWRAEQPPMS